MGRKALDNRFKFKNQKTAIALLIKVMINSWRDFLNIRFNG